MVADQACPAPAAPADDAVTPLAAKLAARIREEGPIGVDAFIAAALTDAEHGYYSTRDPLGAAGDFVTAPEISQIFGELIGAWCAVVWQAMGEPAQMSLIELGPGRGTLLADALRVLPTVAPACARAVTPVLIEASGRLRQVQAATLRSVWSGPAPLWHERFEDSRRGPAIVIANEFFDALPVRQFVREGKVWRERRVGLNATGDGLVFTLGAPTAPPLDEDLAAAAAEGAIFERCEAGERLVASIALRLREDGGAALIVDYGHTHPHWGETLQAVHRHRFSSVLDRPGETDLSHHVDFGTLAAAARGAGATVFGPIPQGLFLARLGIAERAQALMRLAPQRAQGLDGDVRRLIDPRRMGLLFKAMAIAAPPLGPLPGFLPRPR